MKIRLTNNNIKLFSPNHPITTALKVDTNHIEKGGKQPMPELNAEKNAQNLIYAQVVHSKETLICFWK